MRVLLVCAPESRIIEDTWKAHRLLATHVTPNEFLSCLTFQTFHEVGLVDAVALVCDRRMYLEDPHRDDEMDPMRALMLARLLRQSPDDVAMADGRKWKSLPILVLTVPDDVELARAAHVSISKAATEKVAVEILTFRTASRGADIIGEAIRTYYAALLDELDNLGFVVTYKAGRYQLRAALQRRADRAGYYYSGKSDRRAADVVTVDRDVFGVQLDVEIFEQLINRDDVTESELQRFFEENPHFLSSHAQAIPHVQLRTSSGELLVPDFVLRPIVACQRDSRWEVLDLKRPQARLLAGSRTRRRLSQDVAKAIRQLRDYGDYFADARNSEHVFEALGYSLKRPKLGVLIGRLRDVDVEALEQEQGRLNDVRIVTYDEILEEQRLYL